MATTSSDSDSLKPEASEAHCDERQDDEVAEREVTVAAPAPDRTPVGYLDRADFEEISGWVWNPSQPNTPIDIEILDGEAVVLKICAEDFRDDLLRNSVGDGRHAFVIRNIGGLFPLSRHRLRVRRADDGLDLVGSPCWLTRPWIDDAMISFMEGAVRTALGAANSSSDLSQPLARLLITLNDLINGYDRLARSRSQPQASPAMDLAASLPLTDRMADILRNFRDARPPIYFEPVDDVLVSVIIPVFNKFSYTYDCIKSIQDALPERSFEIIIVDDGSEDETLLSALVFGGGIRVLRNSTNLGFVRSCNAGAATATGKYLFFLNNDTLVKKGWLDQLVETFEQVPNVGIAGSRLLFPNGQVQDAGGIIWRLGDGWNWGRGREPGEPAFSFLRDADYVSGAALMIERELFSELNGFDELFAPAYYEDTDLAFRVRARGRRVVVQPTSEVIHFEGITAGTDMAGAGMKRFQQINQGKFYRRWKETLATHRMNGHQPELEAERSVTRRAYFIDDTTPTPDQDAGSNAAFSHIKTLIELGYKVVFLAADNMANIEPYTKRLQAIGVECLYQPYYWSCEGVFRRAPYKPDLVYLHRYSNAVKYAAMIRQYFPACRVVYNVADLHFLRMTRQAQVEGSEAGAERATAMRHGEIAAMQLAKHIIVHSSYEATLLKELDSSLDVTVVPWEVVPRPTPQAFAARSGAAFLGGFGHPPNVDAAWHLVNEIVPRLVLRLPEVTTYLIGSRMPPELSNVNAPGVRALGYVPVLGDVLHRLRCTIVPLRYGAGVKGKVLESFAHGLPCVMSEVAAEGLDLPDELMWLIARTPHEFADKIAKVHEDGSLNSRLSAAGLAYIEQRHGAGVVRAALAAAVFPCAVRDIRIDA